MSCPEGLGAWLGMDGPEAVLAQTGRGRAGVLEELVTHFPSSRSDRQQASMAMAGIMLSGASWCPSAGEGRDGVNDGLGLLEIADR